ncbi:MAG: restriction endonuclease subunit S [Candidatus Pacebacteria bacterium]|nr:restriction endonuclease subunit S [Candidatus Paceibacterota bacterium]
MYSKIIKKIEEYKNGWDHVRNIVDRKKGVEVGSEAYQQDGMSFGRVADCSINGVADTGKKISKELYQELKNDYQPKRDDILFTKDGTIGLSYVVKEEFEVILSGAFLRLSLKDKYQTFEKECLSLIFNSIISKMQVEKLSGGAIIAHLKPSDFEKFKIPLINLKIQKQIAEKIRESHKLRKESKELLEEAKKRVEKEIEKEGK